MLSSPGSFGVLSYETESAQAVSFTLEMARMRTAGIVLCGGLSKRMKRPKALAAVWRPVLAESYCRNEVSQASLNRCCWVAAGEARTPLIACEPPGLVLRRSAQLRVPLGGPGQLAWPRLRTNAPPPFGLILRFAIRLCR